MHADTFTGPANQDIQLLIFLKSIKHVMRVINTRFLHNAALQHLARAFDHAIAQTSAVIPGGKSSAATSY